VAAQRPPQPAQQFPLAAPVEFGAQCGGLAGGDSLGANRVGEGGLKARAFFVEQALSTVDPAPLALELRGQCRNGELDPLNVLFNRLVEAVRRRRRGPR